jgi:hypothetical protein
MATITMNRAELAAFRRRHRGPELAALPFAEAIPKPPKWRSGRARHEAGQEKGALLKWQLDRMAAADPRFAGALCEVRFHPIRKWRLDVAIFRLKIGVEIHGGVFLKPRRDDPNARGAHSRGAQQVKDWEKANAAQIAGWIVLNVLPEWIPKGIALQLVEHAVNAREPRCR